MKKKLLSLILILCMLAGVAPFVLAATEHPIRMTAEPDPECVLTGPGTLSYVRFVIKNTGDEDYTMRSPVLSGEVLEEDCTLYFENSDADEVTIEPGTVREFRVNDIYMPENALNTDVRFTLSWLEATETEEEETWEEEAEPEDPDEDLPAEDIDPYPEEEEYPDQEDDREEDEPARRTTTKVSYVKRKISTTICVETSDVPAMSLSVKADSSLVRTDGDVTVKYVLTNPTKYDFEDITLTDAAAGGEIELEKTKLRAGDAMTVLHTFSMGKENAVLCPEATYSVRGKTCRTKCEKPYTVEYMYDSLTLDVQQFSATEEGTMFSLTVTNAGTHRMRDIELEDDTGTALCRAFTLNPGQSRAISYTYGSYTGLSENRRVSFLIHATDSEGETYLYQKPGSFEIRPYVGSGQVSLLMNVTLADYEEEKNTVQLLFEVRNYSDVAISNAVITETEVLRAAVRTYPSLSKGVTTFTMDFALGSGISVLTFHMEADDAGGTHYATEPVSLHVDQLALSVKNGTFGGASHTVIDTSNTVFDTDKYKSYITTGLLALLLAAMVFILISCLFRGAESYIRKTVPEPEASARITGAGSAVQDTARLRFGYMKPAKLRYAETEEPAPEEQITPRAPRLSHTTGTVGRSSSAKRIRPAVKRPEEPVKIIQTGTFSKPGRQIRMLTSANTLIFDAEAVRQERVAFISPETKKKTAPRAPVFAVNKQAAEAEPEKPLTVIAAEPEKIKKAPEKRLTMKECLKRGMPYTFETDPLPAVRPAETEPEIVFIGCRSPLA